MPEQTSKRGVQITASPFDAPFESPIFRYGVGGLDLQSAVDQVVGKGYRRLQNVVHSNGGELTGRPGLITFTNDAANVHSIRRLNDPEDSTFTRVWGAGTKLYVGAAGLTEVDSGYSGDPLTLIPYRPPLSSESWMFVADRLRNRKVRPDGLDLPIGLLAPSVEASVTVAPAEVTPVCAFDLSDASQAAAWTNNAGFDYSEVPNATAIPVTTDGGGVSGNTVEFKANPSTTNAVFEAGKGYYSFWGLPHPLNLNQVGTRTAEDEDLFHLWLKLSHPDLTAEVRIYFVVSEVFDPSILPGTSFSAVNQDFYVKTWRQNDFSLFLQARASQIDTTEIARVRAVRDQDLRNRGIVDARTSWEIRRAERDPLRTLSFQGGAGREQWVEFGTIGTPVRRGDFQRIGATEGRDWAGVTGIMIYLQTVNGTGGPVAVSFDDCFLTGGFGPDTSEPGAQQYDYRYTDYDPRTGAESNPSPEQTATAFVDSLRQSITVDPAPNGDAAIRQRFYRRGGSLISDWFYLGANDADGAPLTDILSDAAIVAAGAVEFDNDALVTSVNAAGDPVYGEPCPILFGPLEDLIFALGDPLRPGDVAYCKPGQPDSWPAANHTEVCPPGEVLMNGGIFANQAFCFSQERGYYLYPNLTAQATSVTASPSACRKGLVCRWGMAIGRGAIWFVARDGAYKTLGGSEERISDPIQPLFEGIAIEDHLPIDLSLTVRLVIHDWDLWLLYTDTAGTPCALVYSILYQYWRFSPFAAVVGVQSAYSDEGGTESLLFFGANFGAYTHGGTSDAGFAIPGQVRTGAQDFGRPREDKLLGDLILHVDRGGADLAVVTILNDGAVVNPAAGIVGGAGRQPYVIDPFGLKPQKARDLALDVSWSTDGTPPILYQWAASLIPQPDVTVKRVTQWEDLGHPDEVYLTGLTLDVDTGNGAKSFYVEYDNADTPGQWATLGPYDLTHDNRHKKKFSWPVVKAHLVRIRPIGDCTPWMLYRADWIFDPEPPRVAGWDINHENSWDQYVTGVDLECNTLGLTKTVEVYIDGTLALTSPVLAAGRRVVHLTVQPPRRGHILRFVAIDANPGLLYSHRWHADPEPSEQTNWNQNYVTPGLHDKYVKGVLIECDTFGQNKAVTIEIDGEVVETISVNTDGRLLREFSWEKHLGRVFRMLPIDNFPGRLYSHQWIFDSEPLALSRWETQLITHGEPAWHQVLYMHVTYKSAVPVTLTLTAFNQDGDEATEVYALPATLPLQTDSRGDGKVKVFVPMRANKGVLYRYVITASEGFWLYREETTVTVLTWGGATRQIVHPFGDDDLDPSRPMGVASLQATTGGGALGD